ncbi:hypothetical protein N7491_005307 [Penicillium cf. griseofulvum]|uniref:DUF7703 domain-containing protein n=1 Tax=Penicillium cf. griseofulvum TaxID=2972120 RepID=A0A9W9J642_9EURO|nr:hypothetical protein N7472_007999 [Penicillium cf. griseofulvum]KAJ5434712.1 hypothetical protein N7491_005307 [Penicillium cf. griseofulvum]KAJ5452542.1 hypothetical protein N7445_000725 [Penicillium cf. griseofulvum]
MDSPMSNLPAEVSAVLNANFTIIQIVAMFGIGAWNSLEVVIGIFERFKKYRGLYFWSMQIAAWGILLHAIPAQTVYMRMTSAITMSAPFLIGWVCMVTGQAVVLYSRLHLVVADIRHVRWVLCMIIANFFILHIPMAVLYCLNLGNIPYDRPAAIYDRLQTSGFAIQDTVICAIYVREALRALKPVFESKGPQGRKIIYRIIIANLFGIFLNILIVVAEYKIHYIVISFKTVAYSLKLKLEFHALMQLRELTRTYPCALCQDANGSPRGSSEINIFDMFGRNSRSQDTEMQAVSGVAGTASPAHSARSGTYDFHEAMRQTLSTVNSVESQASARPRIHSLDTQSMAEMALLKRSK